MVQRDTHTKTRRVVRETDEISNTVLRVFVEDHLFLPVLLFGFFSILYLC